MASRKGITPRSFKETMGSRDLPQHGVHIQRQAARRENDRARAKHPRAGGQRSAQRKPHARQCSAHRRRNGGKSSLAERFDKPLADLFDMRRNRRRAWRTRSTLSSPPAELHGQAPTPDSTDPIFKVWPGSIRVRPGQPARRLFLIAPAIDPDIDALVGSARAGCGRGQFVFCVRSAGGLGCFHDVMGPNALASVPDHARGHVSDSDPLLDILTKRAA